MGLWDHLVFLEIFVEFLKISRCLKYTCVYKKLGEPSKKDGADVRRVRGWCTVSWSKAMDSMDRGENVKGFMWTTCMEGKGGDAAAGVAIVCD